MLAVSSLTYTAESMALNDALETLTLGGTYDVNEVVLVEKVYVDHVAELVLVAETLELGQVALGSHTGLLEVTELGLGAVLFLLLLETKLQGIVAVGLNCLDLSNHTRTYFDNSARQILAVGTENGCHSDFLS